MEYEMDQGVGSIPLSSRGRDDVAAPALIPPLLPPPQPRSAKVLRGGFNGARMFVEVGVGSIPLSSLGRDDVFAAAAPALLPPPQPRSAKVLRGGFKGARMFVDAVFEDVVVGRRHR
uniref:Uncharacterized protein n=1 Tax=Panagrolaimus sp. ES5 TaxID=591445 RepID=A0AC34GCF6_9BILA